jgi:hypothetical protein
MLGLGWSAPENWGIWSNSNIATIYVPLAPKERKISLQVVGFSEGEMQEVAVYVAISFLLVMTLRQKVLPISLSLFPINRRDLYQYHSTSLRQYRLHLWGWDRIHVN